MSLQNVLFQVEKTVAKETLEVQFTRGTMEK